MKVTTDEMETALHFLSHTDNDYARAKSYYYALTEKRKVIKAQAFGNSSEPSDGKKEQAAYRSMAYLQHLDAMEQAHLDYLTLETQRLTAGTVIDIWRSLNSAKKMGAIV